METQKIHFRKRRKKMIIVITVIYMVIGLGCFRLYNELQPEGRPENGDAPTAFFAYLLFWPILGPFLLLSYCKKRRNQKHGESSN
jgi:hypothetical protein